MGTENLTPQQREFLEAAVESSDRLIDLINNVLDLSRLEAGKMFMDFNERDLCAVVGNIQRDFRPLAAKQGLDLEIECPAGACLALFDDEKIERVLVNLVVNAIKFTPAGGRVRIALSEAAGEVVVAVTDTGRGIPEERIPELFDEFTQLGREDSSRGSGLGLSICKRIIECHQGRIWVESSPGRGSRFAFTLPKPSRD
jgi:signal transduction histidine kinase